jgi:hypothetical protein
VGSKAFRSPSGFQQGLEDGIGFGKILVYVCHDGPRGNRICGDTLGFAELRTFGSYCQHRIFPNQKQKRLLTSCAQEYAKLSTAALAAQYTGMTERPIFEAAEDMLMIRPPTGICGTVD